MFAQVDESVTRSEGGLGIGLSLVKGIAELHGGRVEVVSEGAGRGSEFTLYLPLAGEQPALSASA
jgi:two-component system CheB/CheR fusion protein